MCRMHTRFASSSLHEWAYVVNTLITVGNDSENFSGTPDASGDFMISESIDVKGGAQL